MKIFDSIGVWGDSNSLGNGYAYVGNKAHAARDPHGDIVIFIHGRGGAWNNRACDDYTPTEKNPRGGMNNLASCSAAKHGSVGETWVLRHNEGRTAESAVRKARMANPTEPVVIIGYSWGGSEAHQVTGWLANHDICVDLLVMVSAVDAFKGHNSDNRPSNAARHVNIFEDMDATGFKGGGYISGAENWELKEEDHYTIEDSVFTWNKVDELVAGVGNSWGCA